MFFFITLLHSPELYLCQMLCPSDVSPLSSRFVITHTQTVTAHSYCKTKNGNNSYLQK